MLTRNNIGIESGLELQTIRTRDEMLALRSEWEALHAEAGGTVFQTFTWITNWWDVYSRQTDVLHLVAVRDGKHLIAILPAYLMTTNLVALKLTQLRFLGISDAYGEYAPLVHPGYITPVSKIFARYCFDVLHSHVCDTVSFFRFSPESAFMNQFLTDLAVGGLHVWYTPFAVPRMRMRLPATWEEYLDSLSHMEQKMLKRRTRALMNRDVQLEIITGPSFREEDFNDFVRLHTAAWIDEGLPGYYRGSPRFKNFHSRVLERMAADSTARIYFFSKAGVRFAAVQAFFISGECCFYLSGMDRQHELAPQSPGKVLLSIVVKKAIEEGCSRFDFQGGREEYKSRLGGQMTSFSKALVWTGRFSTYKVYILVTLQMLRYIFRTLLFEDTVLRLMRRFFGTDRRSE